MMDEGLCGLPQEQAMERLPDPTVSTILNHFKIIKVPQDRRSVKKTLSLRSHAEKHARNHTNYL